VGPWNIIVGCLENYVSLLCFPSIWLLNSKGPLNEKWVLSHLIIFALYGEKNSSFLKLRWCQHLGPGLRTAPQRKNVMKFSAKLKFRMSLIPLATVQLDWLHKSSHLGLSLWPWRCCGRKEWMSRPKFQSLKKVLIQKIQHYMITAHKTISGELQYISIDFKNDTRGAHAVPGNWISEIESGLIVVVEGLANFPIRRV
jgi:hypothetical protein